MEKESKKSGSLTKTARFLKVLLKMKIKKEDEILLFYSFRMA